MMLAVVWLAAAAAQAASGASDIQSVEVTVYNQNFGLVKEVRQVTLGKGLRTLAVEDVAAKIDPSTVHFKAVADPTAVQILEQNYQYDLLSPTSVLKKSVGKTVRLHRVLPDGKKEIVEGTLLSSPEQGTIVRAKDGRILLNPTGEIEVVELPEGLIARPTLFWVLSSDVGGRQLAELSYITENISWNADYVATLSSDDTKLDLDGWVTLTNNSGATYKDARLKLVAGDVRRERPVTRERMVGGRGGAMAAEDLGFQESQLFEYHLYTLGRPTTVKDKEIKQVALLHAVEVPVTKKLFYEGQGYIWRMYGANYRPGDGIDTDPNQKVNVVVELTNSEENHLGMPLPKGRVRVYKADAEGQLQFVGEDTIDHTPRDETVKLYIGDAFDVKCTRTRTNYRKISNRVIEQSFDLYARNRKEEAITLTLAEHPWGDWEVLEKSHEYVKKDAHTINFEVDIPAGGEVHVTYTVRSTF
jgi:hypothetical protein